MDSEWMEDRWLPESANSKRRRKKCFTTYCDLLLDRELSRRVPIGGLLPADYLEAVLTECASRLRKIRLEQTPPATTASRNGDHAECN